MKTSIATVSISGNLQEKLSAISQAGFDGIEVFENDFLTFDKSPAEVSQMAKDHGLEIMLFQPFRDFEGMPAPHRARAFDRAERKFDLMNEMDVNLVLVCSNTSPIALGGIDRAVDDFSELCERAEKKNIKIGYEALAWGTHINDHRDVWEIVRRVDKSNMGIILDSFHTLARNIDPNSIRSIPADKIFFVQLADAPKIDMDLLYWSRHFRNMPGQGDLDVSGFLSAVLATGYDDVLSLEVFNDQFRTCSPKTVSIDGHRSLTNLTDQVKRLDLQPGQTQPTLPAPIIATGIEFIEFSANALEAEQLASMFKTMGFSKAAEHTSKSVAVWRQGNINLVINTEHTGFAHSSYLLHGSSVCDIGIRVEDAALAVERAHALGAGPFEQTLSKGELMIPAIRGAGGGLIRFIDDKTKLADVWETEFNAVPDNTGTIDAGLQHIDHIAQTMNYEEMLSWQLFYTSLFDTTKSPIVDVIDPSGLVRSQAIENSDGTLRVTLNGAENQRTIAGQFVAESFGPAVQHLAFSTHDIFATVRALKQNGFTMLEISRNYYDDLEARLGIDPELCDQLRENNILYDRDENGEYFQLYSPNYGEGFFFEIIERRDGYAGYGAFSAPFRIAAQSRLLQPKGMPKH